MKRNLAWILILTGLLFTGWNGYIWVAESSSGKEKIGENDIVVSPGNGSEKEKDQEPVSLLDEEATSGNVESLQAEESLPIAKQPKKQANEPLLRDYGEYKPGDEMGWLLIPSLNLKYPLFWGTDDETLTQGVGYHAGNYTTPPDGLRHTVLSGHRDTVFRELGELKEGTKMYIQFEEMQYEYEIKRTWVTDAEDRTVIIKKEEPVLTLTTCYPFRFIGPAPDRYIIEAPLVNITEMQT